MDRAIRDNLPWDKYRKRSLLEAPPPGQPDTRPFCVWTEEEAELFYAQDARTQQAWQDYATREAKAFDDRNSYDKQVYLYHQWTPELRFKAWLAATKEPKP